MGSQAHDFEPPYLPEPASAPDNGTAISRPCGSRALAPGRTRGFHVVHLMSRNLAASGGKIDECPVTVSAFTRGGDRGKDREISRWSEPSAAKSVPTQVPRQNCGTLHIFSPHTSISSEVVSCRDCQTLQSTKRASGLLKASSTYPRWFGTSVGISITAVASSLTKLVCKRPWLATSSPRVIYTAISASQIAEFETYQLTKLSPGWSEGPFRI